MLLRVLGLIGAVVLLLSGCAASGGIDVRKYIFYLHGSVEEQEGITDKYTSAIAAIARRGVKVVSEVRLETEPTIYADKIRNQVVDLMGKGVSPGDITISGYSKGAVIALAASAAIGNADVNYVLLAGCSEFLNRKYGVDPTRAVGRILSIYDLGDSRFASCKNTFTEEQQVTFREIALDSGKGHRLFRIPKEKFIEQWRDPLWQWAGV